MKSSIENNLICFYRVKELRRNASSASTSRSMNVAMSNILMNIPASGPSLFQPSNVLCSSTPMRQSTKQFTNKGAAELHLDPSETPLRGPGARRKTSSAGSRVRNSSANTSVNTSVARSANTSVASKVSLVRHVAQQNVIPTVSNSNTKQNVSSNSESDQTDTDSNNITGPQKPIDIGPSAQLTNILAPKKNQGNVSNINASQNIPVLKSTDTENDFPTTDFNDEELNDLNRTGGKQNVAASVPAFSVPRNKQTGSDDINSENRLGAQSGISQISSVSASVPVLRKKMYTSGQTESKASPVLPNDIQNEKQPVVKETQHRGESDMKYPANNGAGNGSVKDTNTQVLNLKMPKVMSQSEKQSAYFTSENNKSGSEQKTQNLNEKTKATNGIALEVRSEMGAGDRPNLPLRIPSLTHESIDDDMLFDPPSVDQRPEIQRTLSDRSGGLLSPPTPRTTPRVPQDPSLEPEIPAVLPAKSSDLTTFSQRSPRWFLQNHNNNNGHVIQQTGYRPEPFKTEVTKNDSGTSAGNAVNGREIPSHNPPNQFQIPTGDFDQPKTAALERHDSFKEKRQAVIERYMNNNSFSKHGDSNSTGNKDKPNSVYDPSSQILEKLDKLSQKSAKPKSDIKEQIEEPISANWFETPANHDAHVAASFVRPKAGSEDNPGITDAKGKLSKLSKDRNDCDETDLKKVDYDSITLNGNVSGNKSMHSDSGIASESTFTKSDRSKADDQKNVRDYFSDSGARPKQNTNIGNPNRQVPSPKNFRQAFNDSPVFKDIVSGSPKGPRSNSPVSNSSNKSNGVIKTEKIKPGAVFSPIHPQPVTTSDGATKSTAAVSKDIIHPTPVGKASSDSNWRATHGDSETTNGAIDFK